MTTTIADLTALGPLEHDDAMELQRVELDRTVAMLRSLTAEQWNAPVVECPGWNVRTMYAHVLGACEAGASFRENARQMRRALAHRKRNGGPLEAALSAIQIVDRQQLDGPEIVRRLAEVAPRTIRARRRLPRWLRNGFRLGVDGPVVEKWSLGYLTDTIYLRDLWMHRVDASRAFGGPLELDAHDARIVADVAVEWARRHGATCRLELTGPAGGSFAVGTTPVETLELDAVDFARTLSGRAEGRGLLTTIVPF